MDPSNEPLLEGTTKTPTNFTSTKFKCQKQAFIILPFALLLVFYLMFIATTTTYNDYDNIEVKQHTEEVQSVHENIFERRPFLVYSPKCQIPDVRPFNKDAKRFYKPRQYASCRKNHQLLTSVTYNDDNTRTVYFNEKIAPSYSKSKISCCYMNVTRITPKEHEDDRILMSNCVHFSKNFTTNAEYVSVKCHSSAGNVVYENTHALIPFKNKQTINSTNAYSVLIVGIDSISRLNLIRTMPETYQFLESNDWNTLEGYNKMEDNTFPNVMAIFTGYNSSESYRICNPRITEKLDNCSIIWKRYKQFGYTTAYAEDQVAISTFNYKKTGFKQEPTDHYFRPLMIASEKLKQVFKDGLVYCIGPETYGEKLFDLAHNFANIYKNHPSFGFFWINSFSHNELNAPGGMDGKVRAFLEGLQESGVLNNTIVIFLSDHGMRFGDIRYTRTGWFEERLPYIYISVPKRFQKQYPNEYQHLIDNKNKLTTPFDLHMTLQHILVLSGKNTSMPSAKVCSKCKSLFERIDDDRGCHDVGIEPHWCTCYGYTLSNVNDTLSVSAAEFVLAKIRKTLVKYQMCAKYSLKRIHSSQVSNTNFINETYMLLTIETRPKAVFEATVSIAVSDTIDAKWKFKMQGSISRLDSYSAHSGCIKPDNIRKYCYCQ